ncbi:MAG: hypothetical protein R6X16_16620 [Anaerolineae bacterium]
MTDSDNRWMPPSPHREKILEEIASGAAHIVERGHNVPPLLVFEDGGMIELPRVRLAETRRGMNLVAADEPESRGETRYYDVCGTVDEILGQVREGKALDRAELSALVGDIQYMLERMSRRSAQYAAFFDGVGALVQAVQALERPAFTSAGQRLDTLNASLAALVEGRSSNAEAVTERAEYVRALAQASEDYLALCKSAAIRIGALFDDVRGGRSWAPANDATPPPDARESALAAAPDVADQGGRTAGGVDSARYG